MQYQGGKSRISKPISEIIIKESIKRKQTLNKLISLFCGACSIESQLAKKFNLVICNDNQPYLIALLKGAQAGYILPESMTKEEYYYIKEHKDEDPVLTGFAGFGCSFGGKWFGGYAKNNKSDNYALRAKNSLLKDMKLLTQATFTCLDYKDVPVENGDIIYADPPYMNTTGYGKEKFNSEEFWAYARKISENNLMFISEQTAPDDFVSIWEKPIKRILDVNKENNFQAIEKLFIHKNWIIDF